MFRNLFSAANISASGMSAERMRMEIVANNIANANSTRTADGDPYRRQQLVFSEALGGSASGGTTGLRGVRVVGREVDQSPFPEIYAPHHPDAVDGYLKTSNVKLPNEMVDLIIASRSYEANLKALSSFKEMVEQTLTLLRVSG